MIKSSYTEGRALSNTGWAGGRGGGAYPNAPQLGPVFRTRVRRTIPGWNFQSLWKAARAEPRRRPSPDRTHDQPPRRATIIVFCVYPCDDAEEHLAAGPDGGPEQRPELGRFCQEIPPCLLMSNARFCHEVALIGCGRGDGAAFPTAGWERQLLGRRAEGMLCLFCVKPQSDPKGRKAICEGRGYLDAIACAKRICRFVRVLADEDEVVLRRASLRLSGDAGAPARFSDHVQAGKAVAGNGGWEQGADRHDQKFNLGIADKPHLLGHSASQVPTRSPMFNTATNFSQSSNTRPSGMGADRPPAVALPKVKKLAKLLIFNTQPIQLDDDPRLQHPRLQLLIFNTLLIVKTNPRLQFLRAAVLELAARAAGARFVARGWHGRPAKDFKNGPFNSHFTKMTGSLPSLKVLKVPLPD